VGLLSAGNKLRRKFKKMIIEFFQKIYASMGVGNLLAITLFLLSSLFTIYFYFKALYRLVFSTGVICENCKELGNFINKNNLYKTRALFYNNGRKTLSKKQIEELKIISKHGEIKNAKILKGNNIDLSILEKEINILFDHLDANDFFIIEIEHSKQVEVYGRVCETGIVLNREPQRWMQINLLSFILSIILIFYTIFEIFNNSYEFYTNREFTIINILKIFTPLWINLIIIFLFYSLLRYIHSLFFIPDKISSKYLNSKNKLNNEFNVSL
jgi:hypothetical protein